MGCVSTVRICFGNPATLVAFEDCHHYHRHHFVVVVVVLSRLLLLSIMLFQLLHRFLSLLLKTTTVMMMMRQQTSFNSNNEKSRSHTKDDYGTVRSIVVLFALSRSRFPFLSFFLSFFFFKVLSF